MRLKRRAFVEELDFVTSPGHLDGAGGRARLGLAGGGPKLVITDRALFRFDDQSGEMTLTEIAPGESIASIQSEVGWSLRIASDVVEMKPPDEQELQRIRHELDPEGLYR
jgi:glutaconate CoA-transferase subunit B